MNITPKNWSEFQHYKDRSPQWIKLHRKLLDDFEFARLPLASRALAPMLWLLASEYEGGVITASLEEIAFRFRVPLGELEEALQPLVDSGFFTSASEVLADCKQDAIPEKRREREREEKQQERGASAPPDADNVLSFRQLGDQQSAEDEFWALVDQAAKARTIPRSLMAKLLKLNDGDFDMALATIKAALAARNPVVYLGKVTANIRAERELDAGLQRGDEKYPAFIRNFKQAGYHVEKRRDGKWRCGAEIYDDRGEVVGW